MSKIALENPIDIRELLTTGSVLEINEDYDNEEHRIETEDSQCNEKVDIFGEPMTSSQDLLKQMTKVQQNEYVMKKILEEGGGLPLHNGCTVSIKYSGYFEGSSEPFDVKQSKPLVVNLADSGLLLGLDIAVKSMLVGETAVFLLNYKVMFGELGVPPRIKPRTDCIFYIKLIKSILTPEEGQEDSEKSVFRRVYKEAKSLYRSGVTLFYANNFSATAQLFRKGVASLHKCRLADEEEEKLQQTLLIKFYLNLAVCYNKLKQPLKACISCNELNRLNSLWNNEKALLQNAKALRMIGQFDDANKRLQRALKLSPDNSDIHTEAALINKLKTTCTKTKLLENRSPTIGDAFKNEIEELVKKFKETPHLCKLSLHEGLNDSEIEYIKNVCKREKLFCNQGQNTYLIDKDTENLPVETDIDFCNLYL